MGRRKSHRAGKATDYLFFIKLNQSIANYTHLGQQGDFVLEFGACPQFAPGMRLDAGHQPNQPTSSETPQSSMISGAMQPGFLQPDPPEQGGRLVFGIRSDCQFPSAAMASESAQAQERRN